MTNKLRKSVGFLVLLSVLFLYLPLVSQAGGRLGEADRSARQTTIETIAEYLTGETDLTAKMLEKLCYEPSVSTPNWRHFPAVRKLVIAYEAAEAANPVVGGDVLLARLSQAMAQQYEAARAEKSLRPYINMHVHTRPCIDFRNPQKRVFFSELSKKVSEAIRTIAAYTTNGPLGSTEAVIRFLLDGNPNYSPDDAARFLTQSESSEDALQRAISFVPKREREPKLRALLAKIQAHSEASRREPTLNAIAAETQNNGSSAATVRHRRVKPQAEVQTPYVGISGLRVDERLARPLLDEFGSPCSSCQLKPMLERATAKTRDLNLPRASVSPLPRKVTSPEPGRTSVFGLGAATRTQQRKPTQNGLGTSSVRIGDTIPERAPTPPKSATSLGRQGRPPIGAKSLQLSMPRAVPDPPFAPRSSFDRKFRVAESAGPPAPRSNDVFGIKKPGYEGLFPPQSGGIKLIPSTPPPVLTGPRRQWVPPRILGPLPCP
jgi:hypothetical protein